MPEPVAPTDDTLWSWASLNRVSSAWKPLRPINVWSMIATKYCATSALTILLQDQPLSPGKVALAWTAAVGPTMDRVTSVSLGPSGTLTVQATNRHWAREIHRSTALIMSRVNRLLGEHVVAAINVSFPGPQGDGIS